MSQHGLPFILAMLLAAVLGTSAEAQPSDAAQASVSLSAAIEQLNRDLDAERAAFKQQQQRGEQESIAAKKQRDLLASELLDVALKHEQHLAEGARLRREAEQLAREGERLATEARGAMAALHSAVEGVQVRLNEIPGGHMFVQQLQQASGSDAAAARAGLEVLGRLHRQAVSIAVTDVEVFSATGQREAVKLLHVGHIGFAYRTGDNRIGVAIGSPVESTGYRWTESVDDATRDRLALVFDTLPQMTGGTLIAPPIDASGRLRTELAAHQDSLAATIRSGGPLMIPLGLVALFATLLILERLWYLVFRNKDEGGLARRVLEACQAGDAQAALAACERTDGVTARTLAAMLRRRGLGQHAMEDSIQEQLLHELPRLNRFLGGIAMLAAVAPLLGLLGTVTGIIATFEVIRGFGNANPALMAGGISEALVTTAAGLILAIPILLIHSLLKGRVEKIVGDAEKHAATLLNLLAHDRKPNAVTV